MFRVHSSAYAGEMGHPQGSQAHSQMGVLGMARAWSRVEEIQEPGLRHGWGYIQGTGWFRSGICLEPQLCKGLGRPSSVLPCPAAHPRLP